ncbi:hypothetical protein GP2143_09645 [marine gamma proteobacterium HTCC2143]|uniref:Uncharacterized protein n=1 Tax=marine gamma proteobacterium HTCC2143 TaxID=247633 RepID=A0YFP5_9GAMM|nr:hypothetical protein GP2143_09645 [marine gamma proteobacterium HTCC2143]
MNIPIHQQSSTWRYLWLLALIALPALGWYGLLDDFSSSNVNTSISNAGLIYGTARGINALVSLLQGTEFSIPFVTFSIGEVLDPVNDLIERFSGIILVALGSLALQQILLAVVSHTMFNILLSIVAVSSGLNMFLGNPKFLSGLLRIFLVIAFFRFSLGLVVIANTWVDGAFLEEADQQRRIAMEQFQGELRDINTLSERAEQAASGFSEAQNELKNLEVNRKKGQQQLQELNAQILVSEKRLQEQAVKAGGVCGLSISTPFLSPSCSESVKKMSRALDRLESEQDTIRESITATEEAIDGQLEEMACLDNRSRGEKCHFWEILPNVPNVKILQFKLDKIEGRVSEFAENTINLLVSLLLKTVVIPLLFIYLLLKIIRINWARI